MTALQKVSIKQIRNSKGRFWATVAGVVLSTAMILSVLLGSEASLDALRRYIIGQDGLWHWSADQLPAQAAAQLTDDAFSSQWGIYGGKYTAATSQGASLHLYGVAGDFLEMMQTDIVEGTLPQTQDELLVAKPFAARYGLSLGEEVPVSDESGGVRFLKITGIYAASVLNLQFQTEENEFNAFYSLDWSRPLGEDVYRFFSAAGQLDSDYYAHTGSLGQSLSAAWPESHPFYHSTLITLSGAPGPDGSNRTLFFLNLLRGALLVVIAAASGMMIVNSFYISLSERRRTLGMLVSVGATGRQASCCLLYEALCVGAVGIPLGLAAGCGGLGLVFRLLSPLMKGMKQMIGADLSLHLTVRPQWLLLSVLVSLAVLLFSAWLPAHRFAKGSILQAIRGGGEVKVSRHVTRAGKLAGKMLGTEAALAVKSAKRNRRRYTATVSSLAVCVALLIAAAGLARYLPAVYAVNVSMEEYPIHVDYAANTAPLIETDEYQALLHPKTPVEEVVVSENIFLAPIPVPISSYTPSAIQLATALNAYQEDGTYVTMVELYTLPDEEYARMAGTAAPEGTIGCILANRYFYNTQNIVQTTYRQGDTLETQLEGLPVTLYVAGVDDRDYVQHRPGDATRLVLLTGQTSANGLAAQWQQMNGRPFPRSVNISYRTQYPADLKEELELLQYDNSRAGLPSDYLLVGDNRAAVALSRIIQLLLQVILYGFTFLTGLICVCHVVTTISTGLSLQYREFAMLQSLGMTQAGLYKMILMQSIVHSVEALVWGIPLGFLLLWMEYQILSRLGGFLFTIPWWAVWGAALAVFFLALLAAWPHLRGLQKNSVMENLRSED